MGIQGLLPFVSKSCRPANIKDFSGSTVAIDAYVWLHKGAFSCAEKLAKGEKTDGYIYYCMKFVNLILEAGLTPIMVFDGSNLPSKAITEKKRRENREKTRQRGKELLCEGKVNEANECFRRCVDVTPEMAHEVLLACRKKSVDCIVAPYEADAQLAYLAETGMAQLIITEDSDLILFGCKRILFKLDCAGGGMLYEKEHLSKSLGAKASKFSFEKFQYMCILSGCDYLPSLPGIGLVKARKFFSLTTNPDLTSVLPKLPSYLKMPCLTVPNEYVESFIKAYNTFLYQLVFCPRKKKLVPLHPYPEDVNPDDMEYAGKYLPDDIACQIAMGNINIKTMEEFDDSQSNASSVWDDTSATWGSQKSHKDAQASQKESVSAFVFKSQKQKSWGLPKCTEKGPSAVGYTGEDACTNEELFDMYRVHTPPKGDDTEKESFEDDLLDISCIEDEGPESSSQSSPHPRELNIPYKKIVRSRFFSSEGYQSSKDKKMEKCDSINSAESKTMENKEEINDLNNDEEFFPELKVKSPVKENKENIRNIFAKRKIVLDEESPSKKRKSSDLTEIIDVESGASTSTVSSPGLDSKLRTSSNDDFTKPASPKSFFHSRKKPKRYRTTKLSNFDWKNISDSKSKLNSSLGSDGNSCDESFDTELETKGELSPPVLLGETSPFFSTFDSGFKSVDSSLSVDEGKQVDPEESCLPTPESSLGGSNSSLIMDVKEQEELEESFFPTPSSSSETVDLVDEDSSEISVLYSSPNEGTLRKTTSSKVLKPIDNKSKTGKCRTIGLSKNKKGVSKPSMKESLFNFNFIRQPKKEVAST